MAYVFVPPPQPSRKAKELAGAIAQLVMEYQSREGKLSRAEVQMAMNLARQELAKRQSGGGAPAPVVIALIVSLLLLGIALALFFSLR